MKILTIVGARPQFIKAAAVSRAIATHNQHHPNQPVYEVLVHKGQDPDKILSAEKQLTSYSNDYSKYLYGQGNAGKKIVEILISTY